MLDGCTCTCMHSTTSKCFIISIISNIHIYFVLCCLYSLLCTCSPELQPVITEPEVVLKFPDAEKLAPPILQLSEVHIGNGVCVAKNGGGGVEIENWHFDFTSFWCLSCLIC